MLIRQVHVVQAMIIIVGRRRRLLLLYNAVPCSDTNLFYHVLTPTCCASLKMRWTLPTTSSRSGGERRRKMFSKESKSMSLPRSIIRPHLAVFPVRCMMYGFGDDQNPYTETVDQIEDLVIEFITNMVHRAMEIGRQGRVQVEDIVFLVRKDPKKYARVKDLLTMNEELKRARKAFDEVKYATN
ncbi:TAF13 [Cordylochernes scorpioides]|uniref:Transcription initiation factor TFIID subunit 13 n=1 Tax=Cordylochernes scorpioides TaxID=51811 RepID=A0ABY6LN85_9ARAC|nr:TAF13 [Cordylochernes scorpioides]